MALLSLDIHREMNNIMDNHSTPLDFFFDAEREPFLSHQAYAAAGAIVPSNLLAMYCLHRMYGTLYLYSLTTSSDKNRR